MNNAAIFVYMTGRSAIPAKAREQLQQIINSADNYPGVVIIHHIPDFTLEYMSARGLQELNAKLEDLQQMTMEEYHERYFNPADAKDYLPKIVALMTANSNDYVTFFQQVKISQDRDWVWHLSSLGILTRDENGLPLHSITFSIAVDPMQHITHKVNRLLEENDFLRKHSPAFSTLGKREKEVLQLMALGKNAGEAAKVLGISATTAETHRRNIKRKLGAENIYDLIQFAKAFDLV